MVGFLRMSHGVIGSAHQYGRGIRILVLNISVLPTGMVSSVLRRRETDITERKPIASPEMSWGFLFAISGALLFADWDNVV